MGDNEDNDVLLDLNAVAKGTSAGCSAVGGRQLLDLQRSQGNPGLLRVAQSVSHHARALRQALLLS